MRKRFAIAQDQLVTLVPPMGFCFATDRITVDAMPVGYLYREAPDHEDDSGWRFFAGDESQEYVDDPANTMLYEVNDIANYDQSIIPLLETPAPCAFARSEPGAEFESIDPELLDLDE